MGETEAGVCGGVLQGVLGGGVRLGWWHTAGWMAEAAHVQAPAQGAWVQPSGGRVCVVC
jgi:hypothetical protein